GANDAGSIDLRKAAPAAPIEAYRTAMAAAMETITPQLTAATTLGVPALRERIAERHRRRGVPTAPEEILVTSGAVPALWLVLDLRDEAATPLPALAGPGVVTLGSLSKAVWDGLRVGWIRADAAVVERLATHPLAAQVATAPLEEAIAAELLPDLDELLAAK